MHQTAGNIQRPIAVSGSVEQLNQACYAERARRYAAIHKPHSPSDELTPRIVRIMSVLLPKRVLIMVDQHDRLQRIELSQEWHARPTLSMQAPLRCSHIVNLEREGNVDQSRASFARFCQQQSQSPPAEGSRHHSVEIGSCRIKWEGHTEATSHTIMVRGNGSPPFSETAVDFLWAEKRAELLDAMFLGVQIEVVAAPEDDPEGLALARSLLGAGTVYGGAMSSGKATVWSAFRLDARDFARVLIIDHDLDEGRLSRLLQRILEMETYRMLAIIALPKARQVMSELGELEPQLDAVMRDLAGDSNEQRQEQALREITGIAARVEQIASANAYRFAAARAYSRIAERRASEVDEQIVVNQQRYTNFMLKSLQPAMRTCDAAELRSSELAQRVARAANLLNTMVDMVQKKQNQAMLQSVAERAQLQLRLQQAVEGFSIFAISYYAVGLLGYTLKSGQASGIAINSDLLTGIAAPLVFALVWISVRSVRKRLAHKEEGD